MNNYSVCIVRRYNTRTTNIVISDLIISSLSYRKTSPVSVAVDDTKAVSTVNGIHNSQSSDNERNFGF